METTTEKEIMGSDISSFLTACYDGDLSTAQSLHQHDKINDRNSYRLGFKEACARGHIHIAQWLQSLSLDNIDNNHNETLSSAKSSSYYTNIVNPILQITRSVDKVIDDKNDSFIGACLNNDLQTAQRLHDQGGVSMEAYNIGLGEACAAGHLEIAKWLQLFY